MRRMSAAQTENDRGTSRTGGVACSERPDSHGRGGDVRPESADRVRLGQTIRGGRDRTVTGSIQRAEDVPPSDGRSDRADVDRGAPEVGIRIEGDLAAATRAASADRMAGPFDGGRDLRSSWVDSTPAQARAE